jgi:hypothetical protein
MTLGAAPWVPNIDTSTKEFVLICVQRFFGLSSNPEHLHNPEMVSLPRSELESLPSSKLETH